MIDWKILAFAVPLLFATYQTVSRFLPKGTSVFLVNAYASLIGFFLMLALHLLTSSNKSLVLSGKALPIALVIGLLIGLGNYGIIKAYSSGAPQSIFTPIFYVVLISYGLLFGVLLWHEKLNPPQLLSVAVAILGVVMLVYFKK
jgi:drug/metabolite transporter (DMT)-like permease